MPPLGIDSGTRKWFTYSIQITFTALSQRQTQAINVQSDADFVLVKLMQDNNDTTSPQVQGGSLVQIIDQGSQRNLFDQQVPLNTTFGTAQRPYILPLPYRFPRNGTIVIDITNTGIAAQRVNLVLAGYKVWQ